MRIEVFMCALAAALVSVPAAAQAFCGFYVSGADAETKKEPETPPKSPPESKDKKSGGCGSCAAGGAPGAGLLLVLAGLWGRRRRQRSA